jgi:hypothetical protein
MRRDAIPQPSSPRKRGPMGCGTYRFQCAFTVGSRLRGNDDLEGYGAV